MPTVNPNSRLTEPLIAVLLADVQSGAFPPFKTPYDARPILLYLADGSELNDVLTGGTPVADLSVVNLTTTAPQNIDTNTGITAFAGGGQGSATQLTGQFNDVTTVATAGDSVKLLAAANGLGQIVKNSGVTGLDVFPATGDSINGLSANTAIRIPPGATMWLQAIDATTWEGNQVTFLPFTSTGAITAFSGGGQGSAVLLTSILNRIGTCAAAGDSVKLPAAVAGTMVRVRNDGSFYASVFPSSGETIDGLAANTSISCPTGTDVIFYCEVAGAWESSKLVLPTAKRTGGTLAGPATFAGGDLTGAALNVFHNVEETPGTLTTRSATQMFDDNPYARVGLTFVIRILNQASALTMTIAAGSGVTGLTGAAITSGAYNEYLFTHTSRTAATMVYIGSGVGV